MRQQRCDISGAIAAAGEARDREAAGRWRGRDRGRCGAGRGRTPAGGPRKSRANSSIRDPTIDSGGGQWEWRRRLQAGSRDGWGGALAEAARALVVAGDSVTAQGHTGYGAAQMRPKPKRRRIDGRERASDIDDTGDTGKSFLHPQSSVHLFLIASTTYSGSSLQVLPSGT